MIAIVMLIYNRYRRHSIFSMSIVAVFLKSLVLCTQQSITFHLEKWWFAQGVEGLNLF